MAGKGGRSWSDALLGRPWLLVAAVALLVALPVLVLGQASENDTRARLQAAQVESAARAAATVMRTANDRSESIRRSIEALALLPSPESSLIASAVQRGDTPTLQALADTVQRLFISDVRGVYIAVRGEATTISDATIAVESPAGTGLVGRRLPDLPGDMAVRLRTAVGNLNTFQTGGYTFAYPGTADAPSVNAVVATIATRRAVASKDSGVLSVAPAAIIAEQDLSRQFKAAATSSLAPGDEAYLVDERRQLLGRAQGPTPFPLRDLSGDPLVQAMVAAPLVRGDVQDPLGGGTRMVASARLPGTDWWILLLRDNSVVDREIDTVLGQLATARYLLVALLLVGALLIAQAASGQIRQRRALAEANQRTESASLHKSAFLANMSHELRTPLNSINGFSDVLLTGIGGPLTQKQREYLADIRGSGDHLLALINDVLDLSKVEAGKMDLHPTEFDVRETVEGVHRSVAPLAQQKRQDLQLEPGDGGTVRLDQARFRQVLLNVLSNAVKYTPDGGQVTTSVSRRDGAIIVAVRDTGVGIAAEDQARVFDDFARIESGYAQTQQGTGLGLALARRLVRLMGGDITVESRPGQGSTFTVTVPAA